MLHFNFFPKALENSENGCTFATRKLTESEKICLSAKYNQ